MKSKPRRQVADSRSFVVGQRSAVVLAPTAGYRLPATGFTLVEMLVALALIGTIVAMVYGSYAAASRAMDLYNGRMACDDRACLVLRLMARQLRCACLPSVEMETMSPSAPNSDESARPPAPQTEALDAGGGLVSFVTTAGLGTGPARARVIYRHDPSTGTLSICCEPWVYGARHMQDAGNWRPLLGGVRSMEVQFYDGVQWQSAWNDTSRTLPRSARIALTVLDENNRVHEFKTMVPVGRQSRRPAQQVATPAGKRG